MKPHVKPLSYSHRNIVFITLFILFLLSLPVFIFYATGYRYSVVEDKHVITATGGLYLAAEAEDSSIYLDEEEVTGSRIFRKASYIRGIEPGLHRVHVQSPGLNTWVKEFLISPQIVTETESFNLPIIPQLRPVTEYATNQGEMVYFSKKGKVNHLSFATTSVPFVVSTSTATSSYIVNQEYLLMDKLFAEKASTTAMIKKLEEEKKSQQFNFVSNIPVFIEDGLATTTVTHDKMELYKEGDDVYVRPLGVGKDIPNYFCSIELSETAKSRMSFIHITKPDEEVLEEPVTESETTVRDCREKIRIDRKWQTVHDFTFFPDNDNLVLMHLDDGVYVVEVDDRSWQNVQLLYPGKDLVMLVYGGSIFIKDGDFIYEALTELIK